MESGEVGVAFLNGVRTEGQAEGDVVGGIRLGGIRDDGCVGDGELDGGGHVTMLLMKFQ